jgi:hypothetical protein
VRISPVFSEKGKNKLPPDNRFGCGTLFLLGSYIDANQGKRIRWLDEDGVRGDVQSKAAANAEPVLEPEIVNSGIRKIFAVVLPCEKSSLK